MTDLDDDLLLARDGCGYKDAWVQKYMGKEYVFYNSGIDEIFNSRSPDTAIRLTVELELFIFPIRPGLWKAEQYNNMGDMEAIADTIPEAVRECALKILKEKEDG